MKCAVHADVDATGYCRNCGKPMCSACARPVRDVLYCEDCLANVMGHPAPASRPLEPPPAAAPPPSYTLPPYAAAPPASPIAPYGTAAPIPAGGRSSPAAAFILAFVFPGLGAIYNRQYNKGLIYIAIFASLILAISTDIGNGIEPLIGILIAGFIFYTAFEAMQTAQARNQGQPSSDLLEVWSKNRPVVPIVLIGLGVLLLLNNFPLPYWFRLGRLWPLILIGIGVYMFRNRLTGRS